MRRPRGKDGADFERRPWVAPLVVVHRDIDRGRVHDENHRGSCWCDPELVSAHTEARA